MLPPQDPGKLAAPVPDDALMRRWQAVTVALMVVGYSGYYLCRSTLSVNLPLIAAEMAQHGIPAEVAKVRLGAIASVGVLAYAIGKFLSGGLADLIGGRRNFLLGMGGSVLFSLLFAAGHGLPLFTLAWLGNRLVQSMGWVGMVKLTAHWFPYSRYAGIMGVISLSYLFGDAASRAFMGWLLAIGFGWRAVFAVAAAVLFVIFAVTVVLLRESPRDLGLPEPEADPESLFGDETDGASPALAAILRTLFASPAFSIVCVLSLGFTLVRETFNTWTPTYFTEVLGLGQAEAASRSAWFPFAGGVSVLLAGWAGDRLGHHGRGWLLFAALVLTVTMLLALGEVDFTAAPTLPVWLVTCIALVMIGPYSYLGGAIALDFGGKRASATACGIIDGVGYLGGVLAGDSFARATVAYGWRGAFLILAAVTVASAAFALLYLVTLRHAAPTRTDAASPAS